MKEKNIVSKILLVFIGLIYLVPFYIVLNLAFKKGNDFSSIWKAPSYLFLQNFKDAWVQANFANAFKNDVIITVCALILIVMLGAISAYPLSRFKTRINKFVYSIIISCTIIPALTMLVPLYKIMIDIHGINQYWSIILLQVTYSMPIVIFLYTGFIGNIPRELDEAAQIDGVSQFGVFFRIIMPLLGPVTSTILIICGVGIWNDYQFSLFFLQNPNMYTITIQLSMFFSMYESNFNLVAAGCLIAVIPLIILFIALQKYFVKGLVSGALKL